MKLVWSTENFEIAGRVISGFPILLWDTMESCTPVNDFLRYYLSRGGIGSKKSWPNTARALYDFFSVLQACNLEWSHTEKNTGVNIVAVYREYSINESKLARSTIRQRITYVCKFYEYALQHKWINTLPFYYENRQASSYERFLAHIKMGDRENLTPSVIPRPHKLLPKFLTTEEIKKLIAATTNPHHRMLIKFALRTGLRREEIATFPLAYVTQCITGRGSRNTIIKLNPFDGLGIKTKGKKARNIYISHAFIDEVQRYINQQRGDRSHLQRERTSTETLFLNQFGQSFANDGKAIERIVRNIGKKAGIHVHPHMLRHTYATHTLALLQRNRSAGLDPLIFIQRQLGHESLQTTTIYLHLVNDVADNAVLTYDIELNNGEG
jgi:site-specific recombinase XerD